MTLTSISFGLVFLPLAVLAVWGTPPSWRQRTLLVLSLAFFLLAEPWSLPMAITSILLDFGAVRLMAQKGSDRRWRRFCMWFSVIKNIIMLAVSGALQQLYGAGMPFGLVVYTLTAMAAVVDMYKEEIPCETDLGRFALTCLFFPKMFAGPLVEYRQFSLQMGDIRLKGAKRMWGLGQYIHGMAKNAVIAVALQKIYLSICGFQTADITVLSTWSMVLALAFTTYFSLSGFSDMAVGLGRVFGLELPKNFYYPYQARTVEDFFDRFNITVSAFVRKYVYFNLDADQNGVIATCLNLLVVGLLTGLWFGLRINYMLWGAYLAAFIMMEKFLFPKVFDFIPTLFSRIYAFCVVLSSFTIFAGDSLTQTGIFIRRMFGFGGVGLYNTKILYLLSSNWLILVISCFFATNMADLIMTWLRKTAPRLSQMIMAVVDFGILCYVAALLLTA
ncbi:MBOAT family O-acyltransferase [Oscillospiraceae bacterium MB08-C2-2]|nr:MBOAT family O-acyltransferase [Oscillospiraceae bacterium MB08-C2-2]